MFSRPFFSAAVHLGLLTAAMLSACSSSTPDAPSGAGPATPPGTDTGSTPQPAPAPPPMTTNPPEGNATPLPDDGGQVVTLPGGTPVPIGDPQEPAGTQITATVLREYEVPTVQPEGITYDPVTDAFYGGSTLDGSVYRATIDGTVETFLPVGRDGAGRVDTRLAVQGVEVKDDKLYVAGGPSGILHVYRLPGGEKLGTFPTLPGAYLNGIAVAQNGDVYITDSTLPFLYRFSDAQITAGFGLPQQIATTPETGALMMEDDLNPIEANGINETPDGRFILFNNLDDHAIYRLTKPTSDPATTPIVTGAGREIVRLVIEGDLGDADGQRFLDARTLYVMDNNGEAVSKVELNADYTAGRVTAQARSARFHTPSAVAVAPGGVLLVTNAELFDQSEPGPPFFVTAIPQF